MKKIVLVLLSSLFLFCGNGIKAQIIEHKLLVTENDTLNIGINLDLNGYCDGIGFDLKYDSSRFDYLGYSNSKFDATGCSLIKSGLLTVGLTSFDAKYDSNFTAIDFKFLVLPIDSVMSTNFEFINGIFKL